MSQPVMRYAKFTDLHSPASAPSAARHGVKDRRGAWYRWIVRSTASTSGLSSMHPGRIARLTIAGRIDH